MTIGYKGGVVFPLTIVPQDASKPVKLRLNLDYAICEKLCVPAQGQAELVIKPGSAAEPAIAAGRQDRAETTPDRRECRAIGKVRDARRQGQAAAHPCRCRSPRGHAAGCLCRGSGTGLGAARSRKVEGAPDGLQRFVFALDGLPPGASARGADLKITAVAGTDAIETTYRLD